MCVSKGFELPAKNKAPSFIYLFIVDMSRKLVSIGVIVVRK